MSLPPLTATIFALMGDMSEYVAPLAEKNELHRFVRDDTLHFPPRSETLVPIHSNHIPYDGPRQHTRGVEWGDSSIEGSRVLLLYDHRGKCVKEEHIAVEYADDASEDAAWCWLDLHCPRPAEVDEERRAVARAQPTAYPPLHLVRS